MFARTLGLIAAAALTTTVALAQGSLPAPIGAVNDFAELLSEEQERVLGELVAAVETETTAEIAVATVPSLDGMSVEEYANRLFAQWGIGQQGTDNGVLIVVAPNEREMRIEVGYGLEGVLPDGLAGAVIRETFIPSFQANDYGGGIVAGTRRVADIVRRNQVLTAEQRAALDEDVRPANEPWWIATFLSPFVAIGAFLAGTAAGARVISQLVLGLVIGGFAMLMATLATPPFAVALLVLWATGILVLGYRLGRRPKWRKQLRGTGSSAGGSKWISGGGGGGGGGSRSGGSSSSFGGGRSGGGGASGRW